VNAVHDRSPTSVESEHPRSSKLVSVDSLLTRNGHHFASACSVYYALAFMGSAGESLAFDQGCGVVLSVSMPAVNRYQQPIPSINHAVLYARVSSRDQEQEGFSIPAQQRLLREYAAANGIIIAEEFVDVETARRSGREGFGRMIDYLKAHERTCHTIIVEKTDRLMRNLKDWSTLDERGLTIHFVKENVIISPDSKSMKQFVFGIKVLMARNYSMNLSEESRKGTIEKARTGIYPSCAPRGTGTYRVLTGSASSSRTRKRPRLSGNSIAASRPAITASKTSQ
jgi:DNA invertase Pin-like site-specific DNA recombinase